MSEMAIRVENLSKQYRIGHQQNGPFSYKSLRDTLAEAFISPFRRAGKLLRGEAYGAAEMSETIWALKDVSFEVKRGEVVGIIGRNGAGKSTLLKILSRITEPTEGQVAIYGRVSSLLEVGTGFHPELTGRENIYLNGAILGMRRAEIERQFDKIVAFAEVDKFLNTPVKHYSSGMYLRLAFAVAAHLEPEILLVDEVLAVGDAAFQKKCLGKMENVAQEGRTVLFVSHNMGAIDSLCESCFWLDDGTLKLQGRTNEVIDTYMLSGSHSTSVEWTQPHLPSKRLNLRRVTIRHNDKEGVTEIKYDDSFDIVVEYEINIRSQGMAVWVAIIAASGIAIISTGEYDTHPELLNWREPGIYQTSVTIPAQWLNAGHYFVRVFAMDFLKRKLFDRVNAIWFTIVATKNMADGRRAAYLVPMLDWKTNRVI